MSNRTFENCEFLSLLINCQPKRIMFENCKFNDVTILSQKTNTSIRFNNCTITKNLTVAPNSEGSEQLSFGVLDSKINALYIQSGLKTIELDRSEINDISVRYGNENTNFNEVNIHDIKTKEIRFEYCDIKYLAISGLENTNNDLFNSKINELHIVNNIGVKHDFSKTEITNLYAENQLNEYIIGDTTITEIKFTDNSIKRLTFTGNTFVGNIRNKKVTPQVDDIKIECAVLRFAELTLLENSKLHLSNYLVDLLASLR